MEGAPVDTACAASAWHSEVPPTETPHGYLPIRSNRNGKGPFVEPFHYLCHQFFTNLAQFSLSLSSDNVGELIIWEILPYQIKFSGL